MKNIKEKINKIISLVLVILIIFTSLPWDVIAYDDGLLNNNVEQIEDSDILKIKEESLLDAGKENVNSNMIDIENDSVDSNLADKEIANDKDLIEAGEVNDNLNVLDTGKANANSDVVDAGNENVDSNILDKENVNLNVTENDNVNTNIIDNELSNETTESSDTNNQDTIIEDKNIIDPENISASNENNNMSEMPSDNIDEILKLNVAQSSNTVDILSEMAGTEDGFKVQLRWGGTTETTYSWDAQTSEKRVIKLTFYYQNEVTEKKYDKNQLKVEIPGIGKLNRANTVKAIDIAADVYGTSELKRDWSYQYNSQTDTYTFYNNKEIEAGSTFNGSFEMLWQFNSRDCVNNYVQNLKAKLIDGDKTVETQELTLNFKSKRDEYYITKSANSITSADGLSKYVPAGKEVSDYAWVQYTFKYGLKHQYSRALKTRYFIDTFPADCVIAKDTNVTRDAEGKLIYRIDESSVSEGTTREYSIIVGYPASYMNKKVDNTVYLYGTYKDETDNVKLSESTISVELKKIQDQLIGIVPGKNMTPDSVYKEALNGDINFSASLTATSTMSSENNEGYTIAITDDLLEIYNETKDENKTEEYTRLEDDEYKFTSVTVPGKDNFVNANGYTIADGNYTVTIKALYKDNLSTRSLDKYEVVYTGTWGKDSITQTLEKEAVAIRVEVSGLLESIKSFNVTVKGVINVSENVKNLVYSNPKQIINYDFAELLDKEGKPLIDEIDYSDKRIEKLDSDIYGRKVSRNQDRIQIKEYTPAPGTYSAHADIEPFGVDENVEYFTTTLNHSISVNNKDKKEIKEVEIYGVTGKDELETLIEKLELTYSGLSFKNALSSDVDMIDYLEEKVTINKNGKEISIKFDFSDNPIVSTNFSLGYKVDARLNYEEYYNSTNPTYNITTYAYLNNSGLNAQSTGTYNSKTMSTAVDSESILLALASHQQLIKMVKTKYSGEFVQEDAVSPVDSEYTYRLKLRNGYNTLEKTEFVDILEHAELTVVDGEKTYPKSEWYGTFKNVDTSYIESKNLVPQVYYANSTNPGESDWNLMTKNGNGIWTAENQDVKAVKVKIESSIAENSIVYVDINMTSPNSKEVDKKTYNTYTISCNAIDLYTGMQSTYMNNLPSNVVDVRLVEKEYNLVITKTDATSGKKLAGAIFAIYDKNEKIKLGNITGILGDTVIKGLKDGTYTIKEELTPTGYETIDDYTIIIEDGKYTLKCGEDVLVSENEIDSQETIPTIYINIKNSKKTGSIKIHKIDEYLNSEKEKVPLKGIQFDLLKTDGTVIGTGTTDDNGIITFENLEWGNTYIVREKQKQQGYQIAEENIYLSRLLIDKEFDIKNIRETGSVTLVKQDELDESIKLANAKYTLYAGKDIYDKDGNILYSKDEAIEESATNEQGEVTFNELIWGDYYLQESETVYGYDLSEEKYSFTISAENVENSIRFTEKEKRSKAKLQLIKVDEDGSFLPGAEFGLFKGNGDEDGEQIIKRNVETGEEELTFTSLETTEDTYGWKQNEDGTWQSENYNQNSSTAIMESNQFTISNGKLSFEWSVSSESNDYLYYKITNKETGFVIGGEPKKISGTSYGTEYNSLNFEKVEHKLECGIYTISFIYTKNNSETSELDRAFVKNVNLEYEKTEDIPYITNENGQLNIEEIEWGNYYIQELNAPQGYENNDTKYSFIINRDTFASGNKAVTIVVNEKTHENVSIIKNNRKKGKVILTKYAYNAEGKETTETLFNAIYELYSADGTIIGEYTTNEEGQITVNNLDWDSYYFLEKQAPEGYSLSDKKIAFVINSKNVDFEQKLVAYDKKESGEIKINKTIKADSIYSGHGNASFLFKIVGKDEAGDVKVTLYRTITFSVEDLKNVDENGNITKTLSITDIEPYKYEITEEENYRYALSTIIEVKNAQKDGNKGIIDLLKSTENKGEITFENTKENNSLLTDNGLITNTAQNEYYLIGISAKPKKESYEVGMELTASDFIYTLYYSGGQEEEKEELKEGTITFDDKSTYFEDQPGSYITKIEYELNGRKYETETVTKWVMPSDYFTYIVLSETENTIAITGINSNYISPELLYIPSEYNGYKVKRIGYNPVDSGRNENRLLNIDNVISVDISEGIEEIGMSAFWYHKKIQNINFPTTLTNIGNMAFIGCYKLQEVDLSETNLTVINGSLSPGWSYSHGGVFAGCTSLQEVKLPKKLEKIGPYAFGECTNLANVIIQDNSINEIENAAFYNCTGLNSIDLSNTKLKVINGVITTDYRLRCWGAFSNCKNLMEIKLPSDLVTIGKGTFSDCNSLKNIELPSSITSVGEYAFYNCISLVSINFGKNKITNIEKNTFSGCSKLTSIELPSSVIDIGNYAFYGCSTLTSVGNLNSVTSIGNYAFYGCRTLTSVGNLNSVTSIGNYSFYGCSTLTSVGNLNSVTSIGEYAFYDCSTLTSVGNLNSVTSIGNYAFYNCSTLKNIEIPSSVINIGNFVFKCCKSLENINVAEENQSYSSKNGILYDKNKTILLCVPPKNETIIFYGLSTLEKISDSAFYGNEIIENIDLRESQIISIGNSTFSNCNALKNIELPNSVTSIETSAFKNCSSLLNIDFRETQILNIGTYAFSECSNLSSIELPSSVTNLGERAFENCGKLKKIDLSKMKLTNIGYRAFAKCTVLEKIDLNQAELKKLNSEVFMDCISLASIVLPSSITEIGSHTFSACKNLASIELTSSITKIQSYAFYSCNNLTTIKFHGTKEEFEAINVGSSNTNFTSAQVEYISE